MIKLIQGDCLEEMPEIESGSVDLIISDWPYNIKKAAWDKWKTKKGYLDFIGSVLTEYQRILKDNGSFYFFHNDFLQVVEIQNLINTKFDFIFQQLILWNKRFVGAKNKGFLDGFIEVEHLRNYQQMAEYVLFYVNSAGLKTTWDKTGLTMVKHDVYNFQSLRTYFKDLLNFIGHYKKRIIGDIGQKADHCFRWNSTQWDLPTKETYNQLIEYYCINTFLHFKEYEELRKEYEELRKEYEELRYTFNNQKTSHSVWNYEIANKTGHVTPKPVELIENIIKHSSNDNDLIFDAFMGNGTTGVACQNLNRSFIGIEKDPEYFKMAQERIDANDRH